MVLECLGQELRVIAADEQSRVNKCQYEEPPHAAAATANKGKEKGKGKGKDERGKGPCKFHSQAGGCKLGNRCLYRHEGPSGGKPHTPTTTEQPNKPKKVCPYHKKPGGCKFGERCRMDLGDRV